MKKGIQIFIAALLSASFILMPFSFNVSAEESINLGWYYAVTFWQASGFNTIIPTETYSVGSHLIQVPALTFYDNIQNGGSANGYTCNATSVNSNGVSQWSCYLRSSNGSTYGGGTEVYQSNPFNLTESSYSIVNSSTRFYTTLSGSYSVPTAYDNDKRIAIEAGDTYDVFFMTLKSSAPYTLSPHGIYVYPGQSYSITAREQAVQVYGDYYLHHFTYTTDLTSGMAYGTPYYHGLNGYAGEIIPVYMGNRKYMPSDMYSTLLGNPDTIGDSVANSSVNDLDNSNDSLTSGLNSMSQQESQYNQDFNNQINNIDFTDNLSGQQGFLNSANFVITTFNSLIANNPLTILIVIVCIFYVARRFF